MQFVREFCTKMSKTTNKQQVELLVNLMQTQPDIARGFFKGNKEELTKFSRQVEQEMNSAGPPMKNVTEWKKVWADQKKYVRHKAAQNVKASKATGGGPNQEQKFSATEEAIYHLIGMKESVEGVAKTFGLPSSNVQMAEQENVNPMLEDEILNAAFEENDDVTPYQPRAKKPKLDRIKIPTQTRSSADILVEELSIQKGISETLKDQLQNSKKIYRSIDRLHDLFKGHFQAIENIKKNEEQELKRHNLVMENLKLKEVEDKIERNRRQLEIEELKHNSAY